MRQGTLYRCLLCSFWLIVSKWLMKISVIIPSYNRVKDLYRCLKSLELQDFSETNFEVIVVLNSPNNQTQVAFEKHRKKINLLNFKIIVEKIPGSNRCRNIGAANAKGDLIAFLDDDAIPNPQWLNAVASLQEESSEFCAIGGPISPILHSSFNGIDKDIAKKLSIIDVTTTRGVFGTKKVGYKYPFGANMAFKSEVLKQFSFPESGGRTAKSLISYAEAGLFDQLNHKKIIYDPKMIVLHNVEKERLSAQWLVKRFKGESEGFFKTYKRKRTLQLAYIFKALFKSIYLLILAIFGRRKFLSSYLVFTQFKEAVKYFFLMSSKKHL